MLRPCAPMVLPTGRAGRTSRYFTEVAHEAPPFRAALIRSHSSHDGAPAANHPSKSAQFQRRARPNFIGAGIRRSRVRAHTWRSETLRRDATLRTGTAKGFGSLTMASSCCSDARYRVCERMKNCRQNAGAPRDRLGIAMCPCHVPNESLHRCRPRQSGSSRVACAD